MTPPRGDSLTLPESFLPEPYLKSLPHTRGTRARVHACAREPACHRSYKVGEPYGTCEGEKADGTGPPSQPPGGAGYCANALGITANDTQLHRKPARRTAALSENDLTANGNGPEPTLAAPPPARGYECDRTGCQILSPRPGARGKPVGVADASGVEAGDCGRRPAEWQRRNMTRRTRGRISPCSPSPRRALRAGADRQCVPAEAPG